MEGVGGLPGRALLFEEGREVAHLLDGIDSDGAYLEYVGGETPPNEDAASWLPYRPDLKYRADWLGWDNFMIS